MTNYQDPKWDRTPEEVVDFLEHHIKHAENQILSHTSMMFDMEAAMSEFEPHHFAPEDVVVRDAIHNYIADQLEAARKARQGLVDALEGARMRFNSKEPSDG